MKYTNYQMEAMAESLQPILPRRDIAGYAAARNMRALLVELADYLDYKEGLINEYGEDELEDGKPTGRKYVSEQSPLFEEFKSRLDEVGRIEAEPTLLHLKYPEIVEKLSGEEILALDWMLDEVVPDAAA